jgi:RNA polymerase sigma-70 factor, ECF subfamily
MKPMSEQSEIFKRDLLAVLPNLRAFAVSLCGNVDRADDLMQDAILKAWGAQDSFRTGTNIRAWIFTILRNEFYSFMRKQGREVQDSDGFFTENLAVPPSQNGMLDLQDFSKALAELPQDQREALLLVGASGFAYEEAAEICGCRVGTIKSRVSRARVRLRISLGIDGEYEYGPDATSAQATLRSFAP